MMEKEPDSMAVTMKQDYAASEVYSTTSEAPPVSDINYFLFFLSFDCYNSLVLFPRVGENRGKRLAEKSENFPSSER